MRTLCVVLTGLLLAAPSARAGEKGLKGNWKVSFFEQGGALTPWLPKIEPKDVKEWADVLLKSAARYGPRWEREVTLRVAGQLSAAAGEYTAVAEEFARKAIQAIGPKAGAETELRALGVLEAVLRKTGKAEE